MDNHDEVRPLVLSVVAAGNPKFPRFRIADQYLRFWTGTEWTEQGEEESGLMYSDSNEACHEVQRLLMLEYMDRPCRVFTAPVIIKLFSDKPVSKKQLVDWLSRVSKLVMDAPKHGNGPLEGRLGLCLIDWNKIEEIGCTAADCHETEEKDDA
jgi:hypothetical protein